MKAIVRYATLGASCLLFASCAAMHSLTDKTTSLFGGNRVPIAKARPKDWKELPSGKDKAMAYASGRSEGGFFSFFRGPVDFKEPTLPKNMGAMDGSLLPPRAN